MPLYLIFMWFYWKDIYLRRLTLMGDLSKILNIPLYISYKYLRGSTDIIWSNCFPKFQSEEVVLWFLSPRLIMPLVHIIAFQKKPLFIACQFSKPVNRNKRVIHNGAQSPVYHSSQTEGPSEGRTKAPLRRHVTN